MKNVSDKSRTIVALLAFLFGALGIHRMYVGKVGTGIFQFILVITVFFWWVAAIWAFIDFIMILTGNFTDKEGKVVWNWNEQPKI